MFIRNYGRHFVVGMALIAFSAGAFADTTVYKWFDDDGVVHFGESPPDNSISSETLLIPKSPPAPRPAPTSASPSTAVQPPIENAPVPDEATMPVLYERSDISKMSIIDLDARCDEARERMIAPLREAEIEKCKLNKREDPVFCEQFNADFGDGGRTFSGWVRPRMFDDLPQCVEAMEEIHRRQR